MYTLYVYVKIHLHLLGIKKIIYIYIYKNIILKYIIVQISYLILNKTVKMWQPHIQSWLSHVPKLVVHTLFGIIRNFLQPLNAQ